MSEPMNDDQYERFLGHQEAMLRCQTDVVAAVDATVRQFNTTLMEVLETEEGSKRFGLPVQEWKGLEGNVRHLCAQLQQRHLHSAVLHYVCAGLPTDWCADHFNQPQETVRKAQHDDVANSLLTLKYRLDTVRERTEHIEEEALQEWFRLRCVHGKSGDPRSTMFRDSPWDVFYAWYRSTWDEMKPYTTVAFCRTASDDFFFEGGMAEVMEIAWRIVTEREISSGRKVYECKQRFIKC
jgi:hypothetical protein